MTSLVNQTIMIQSPNQSEIMPNMEKSAEAVKRLTIRKVQAICASQREACSKCPFYVTYGFRNKCMWLNYSPKNWTKIIDNYEKYKREQERLAMLENGEQELLENR